MKKVTFLLSVVSVMFVVSCRKTTEIAVIGTMHTTQQDLRFGSTSVVLSQARNLAIVFLQRKTPGKHISIESAETVTRNGVPYLHIINAANSDGFVVLSADSLYKPIVAFNTSGNFNRDQMNAGLAIWFNAQGKNIDYVRSHHSPSLDSQTTENKIMWRALAKSTNIGPEKVKPFVPGKATGPYTPNYYYYPPEYVGSGTDVYWNTVNPLVATTWNQTYPYNQYCPSGSYSGGHVPAGCVPLAMAQVMNYWQYPGNYNWSQMNFTFNHSETARLISDIGSYNSFVSYSDGGSGANDENCPSVFNAFGYTMISQTVGIFDQIFSGARNWTYYSSLLRGEAYSSRPAILSGYTDQNSFLGLIYWPSGSAHCWISDGVDEISIQNYDTYQYFDHWGNPSYQESTYQGAPYVVWGYLHMNWGWGGYNNGWFDYQTNYAGSFPYFQIVTYGIHP